MPRIDVPVTDVVRAGVAPPTEVTGDAANNHIVTNDGRVFLVARNSAATTTRNVTIQTPGTVDGLAVADRVVAVPISSSKYIGPFPTATYNQSGSDQGKLYVDVDNAELRLLAFRLPL